MLDGGGGAINSLNKLPAFLYWMNATRSGQLNHELTKHY